MGKDIDKTESKEEKHFFGKIEHYKRCLKYIDGCRERNRQLASEYSRALMNFSGAALAISITLVGMLGGKACVSINYLIISWFLFVLCILITMISIRFSHIAYKQEIKAIHEDMAARKRVSPVSQVRKWTHIAEFIEIIAAIAFLTGIITLLIFVYKNMNT